VDVGLVVQQQTHGISVAVTANVLDAGTADLWIVVVSLSMLMTPLLVFAEDRLSAKPEADVTYELPDSSEPRVIIAALDVSARSSSDTQR